jgi:geranylgeranyl diphosphate synthase type I
VLVAECLARSGARQAATVHRLLGDPGLTADGVAELRSIIIETGALASCEAMIDSFAGQAHRALESAPITAEARTSLAELAIAATARSV